MDGTNLSSRGRHFVQLSSVPGDFRAHNIIFASLLPLSPSSSASSTRIVILTTPEAPFPSLLFLSFSAAAAATALLRGMKEIQYVISQLISEFYSKRLFQPLKEQRARASTTWRAGQERVFGAHVCVFVPDYLLLEIGRTK